MPNPFASWDTTKQARFTARRFAPEIHLLLDASGSMGLYAEALRTCYSRYLAHIQRIAAPQTMLDQRTFTETVHAPRRVKLCEATPLEYCPGGGTRLYSAISSVVSPAQDGGHLLVVFSDGMSSEPREIAASLRAFWPVHPGWLPVFLGAFPEALSVGLAMGIAEGNCLCFGTHEFPEAFARLTAGTTAYLLAPTTKERKQLAQHGLLRKEDIVCQS